MLNYLTSDDIIRKPFMCDEVIIIKFIHLFQACKYFVYLFLNNIRYYRGSLVV